MPTIREMIDKSVEEGKFGDAILIAWTQVESLINLLLLEEFGLDLLANDSWVDFLVGELGFEQKYKLLKDRNVFSEKEKEIITEFQHKRNNLFHADLGGGFFRKFYDDKEKRRLLDLSAAASDAALESYTRYVNKKYPSGLPYQ